VCRRSRGLNRAHPQKHTFLGRGHRNQQRQKADCNGAFIFVQFHAIHHICKLAIMEPAMPSRLADAVMNPSTPTPRDNSSVAGWHGWASLFRQNGWFRTGPDLKVRTKTKHDH
jgi:hypothetical protein